MLLRYLYIYIHMDLITKLYQTQKHGLDKIHTYWFESNLYGYYGYLIQGQASVRFPSVSVDWPLNQSRAPRKRSGDGPRNMEFFSSFLGEKKTHRTERNIHRETYGKPILDFMRRKLFPY